MKTRPTALPVRYLASLAALGGLLLLGTTSATPDEFSPERFGIGATLVQPKDSTFIVIHACAPNGPAARAGLEVGDRVVALDGQSIQGWSFTKVIDYLIRSEPLPLRITVQRGTGLVRVELVRARMSDIAAEQGFGFQLDSTYGYRLVPLDARPELKEGDAVALDSLLDAACSLSSVSPSTKTTVVYFWTTWCAPCKILFTKLRESGADHRQIAISLDRTCDEFRASLATEDPPGAEYWGGGWYSPLSQSLGVYRRGVPTAALLDPQGRLLRIETGVEAIMRMVEAESPATR